MQSIVEQIERARARAHEIARRTPLERARRLSERLGARVLLKREDLQPVHSFKLRDAYNKIVSLSAEEAARGLVAASAGNHAQGVALAAQKLAYAGDDSHADDYSGDQGPGGSCARRGGASARGHLRRCVRRSAPARR